jgi:5-(aminomethyl)-3-furanmethanol phosphate kinase
MTYLIKIGGSLTPRYILPLYRVLKNNPLFKKQRIFFFPGGGEFADLIRKYRKTISLSDESTHKMALASLDQNAYLIAEICKCPCITRFGDIDKIKNYPAVIAPYRILIEHCPFSGHNLNIDNLSSTSSALYFAHLLKAEFIIATDVDGVFAVDPGRPGKKPSLLREMTSQRLADMPRGGPLDKTVPLLLDRYKIDARVINGKYPERLTRAVQSFNMEVGTVIRFRRFR